MYQSNMYDRIKEDWTLQNCIKVDKKIIADQPLCK